VGLFSSVLPIVSSVEGTLFIIFYQVFTFPKRVVYYKAKRRALFLFFLSSWFTGVVLLAPVCGRGLAGLLDTRRQFIGLGL
jgi:hypothetical protein